MMSQSGNIENILKSNGLEVINNPKTKEKKIFNSGDMLGVIIGNSARFSPKFGNNNNHRTH